MKYRFIRSTLRFREGQQVELDPKHPWTEQRLERGIIEPVKVKKRETKPASGPDEVKDERQDY